jgi:hypothetical protein
MATGTETRRRVRPKRSRAAKADGRFRSVEELEEVLNRALAEVDADERSGSLLRATGMRLRFRFPDAGTVLNLAASEEGGHHVRWAFSDDVDWEPKLELTMDTETANAYLQGKESLAIAIARGKIRCKGDARTALLYVPAARLLADPYRRLIRADFPHLALD